MTAINQQLREFTTQIAFHLTLSRQMISTMQHIRHDCLLYEAGVTSLESRMKTTREVSPMPRLYVTGFHALERRGLAERWEEVPNQHWTYRPTARLTPAGGHVWELLVMAGVVAQLSVPANAKARKRA